MNHKEAGKLGAIASAEYQHKLRAHNIKRYLESPKLCKQCQKVIEYNKRQNDYCNHSCVALFNNKFRCAAAFNDDGSPKPERLCLNCKSLLVGRNKRSNIYCNSSCQRKFQTDNCLSDWLNGKLEIKARCWIKKYLIQTRGKKCEVCGWCEIHPITKRVPIELEHIDGNSENNVISNLKLLCPNCHSLTPTYKNLNKGHGRFKRMQRYKAGKSF